jgi:hypothetical protein
MVWFALTWFCWVSSSFTPNSDFWLSGIDGGDFMDVSASEVI